MNKSRIFSLTALLVGAMVLSACGNGQQEAATGIPQYDCLGSADEALVDLECQEVTVAVENAYLPFNYISSETGQAGGWDYEVIPELCKRLHCQPVFEEVSWDVMIQSVADGLYDMAGDGITITEERDEIVDFSVGYVAIEQRLLVRKGEDRFNSIEEFADNPDLIMATQSQTTNYETAVQYVPEDRVDAYEQYPFAVQALLAGDADAVIIDEVVGLGYQGENADELELIGPSISSDQLGFVFPEGSEIVDAVDVALQSMMEDGFLQQVNAEYFGPDFALTYEDIEEVTYEE